MKKLSKKDLFELYNKVQNKDKAAEDKLIALHKEAFPRNPINKMIRGQSEHYRKDLHTMYLHLYR